MHWKLEKHPFKCQKHAVPVGGTYIFLLSDIFHANDVRCLVNSPVSVRVENLNISRELDGTRLRRGVERTRRTDEEWGRIPPRPRARLLCPGFDFFSSALCAEGAKEREGNRGWNGQVQWEWEKKTYQESRIPRARGFACFGTGRVSDIYMRFAY